VLLKRYIVGAERTGGDMGNVIRHGESVLRRIGEW